MSGSRSQRAGRVAEDAALEFLQARGLHLIARNYRCRLGELDLVMSEGQTLAIIEVRMRRDERLVSAAESVDGHKRRRLIAATRHLLSMRPALSARPMRFDVVAIGAQAGEMRWIKDAFRPAG